MRIFIWLILLSSEILDIQSQSVSDDLSEERTTLKSATTGDLLASSYPNGLKETRFDISENCPDFVDIPTISSFFPQNACPPQSVAISGTNFTGTSKVTFGGTLANSYTVVSPTMIIAFVGDGASGDVSVTTDGGTASLPGFGFNYMPLAAGMITGRPFVYNLENDVPYSALDIPYATRYRWTYSGEGVTVKNGSTNNITIDFSSDATSGDLTGWLAFAE